MGTVREEQIVRLAGSLDVRIVGRVRQQLNELIDSGDDQDVVVDLAQLEAVDATGLGVLFTAHRRAERLGRNLVLRVDGSVEELGHIGKVDMAPGDVFVVETPGGGGYGRP